MSRGEGQRESVVPRESVAPSTAGDVHVNVNTMDDYKSVYS